MAITNICFLLAGIPRYPTIDAGFYTIIFFLQVCLAIQRLTPDFIPLFSSGCETRDVRNKIYN